MDAQHILLAALSLVLMPAVLAGVGSSLAGVLAQRGFPALVNELLAWAMVIAAAGGDVYIAGLWTGDPTHIVQVVAGTATLLAGGTLHSLAPWLVWFGFLRDHVFSIVTTPAKPVSVIGIPAPGTDTPLVQTPPGKGPTQTPA